MEIKTYTITDAQRELLRDLAGLLRNGIMPNDDWGMILTNIVASAQLFEEETF